MPNWCLNEVNIYGTIEEIKTIAELFGCNENLFSFNRFMPMPEDLRDIHNGFTKLDNGTTATHWRTVDGVNVPLTSEELDSILTKHGSSNWYDWCNRNWGVKWDACLVSGVVVELDERYNSGEISCSFETPWGPPEGVYNELMRQFPDVSVEWFYKEPGMRLSGWLGDY